MSLYARHIAWLNATPEGDKQSRREKYTEGGEGSPFLFLPPINSYEYLIDLWHEAGTIEVGQSVGRLSWTEIENWLCIRERRGMPPLLDWEIQTVRHLSEEYSSEYHQASDPSRPAPYEVEEIEDLDRQAINNKAKNILFGLMAAQKDNSKYTVEERKG